MEKLRFVIVLHNHQPVGNDPRIIEEVAQASYRPLLTALESVPWLRHALHVSGPLLAWMETSDGAYLEKLGRMVARGQVELLTGGHYEPILAAIPSADRVAQAEGLSDRIERRFGVRPQGLWLTERVWEPQIVPDLVAAGIRYVFMDDRAFIAAGIPRDQLTAHFLTEEGGERLVVFPLDQRLRTLIPWAPVEDSEAYLTTLATSGHRVAVFGDDDAYWHGWFGGVYLPLLRHQTWIRLARVERALRRGQGIELEQLDLDLDGHPEVWAHSGAFSALLMPHLGGTLVEWTDLRRKVNVLNVLTRRLEWYHAKLRGTDRAPLVAAPGEPPPDAREALAYDVWDRASFRDRFLTREGMVRTPSGPRPIGLRKTIHFDARGRIAAAYRLVAGDEETFAQWFGVELNVFLPGLVDGLGEIRVDRQRLDPGMPGAASGSACILREGAAGSREVRIAWSRPAEVAMSPIRTVAQTERGLEMTCQGHGLVVAWPVRLSPGGDWSVQISARIAGKE